ncbi:MAG: hypothetical protein AVDCRST_MAG20-898, partial [uncultured Acidimicrobiales bacterium]
EDDDGCCVVHRPDPRRLVRGGHRGAGRPGGDPRHRGGGSAGDRRRRRRGGCGCSGRQGPAHAGGDEVGPHRHRCRSRAPLRPQGVLGRPLWRRALRLHHARGPGHDPAPHRRAGGARHPDRGRGGPEPERGAGMVRPTRGAEPGRVDRRAARGPRPRRAHTGRGADQLL